MEDIEEPVAYYKGETPDGIMEHKKYELKLKENIYCLEMILYTDSDDKLCFKLTQSDNLSLYYYYKEFNYNDLINLLSLNKKQYDDLSKIFSFLDKMITNKELNLVSYQYNKIIYLRLKTSLNSKEFESEIKLDGIKLSNEEMFKILLDREKNKDKLINDLIIKNKENEEHIKSLNDKIKNLENKINENKNYFEEKINSLINNNNQINKNTINFSGTNNINLNPLTNTIKNKAMYNTNIINIRKDANISEKNNNDRPLSILFNQDWSGKVFVINCNNNEKFSEVIRKYREKSQDGNIDRQFLFNSKIIKPSLKISELGIGNFSKIEVSTVLSHKIENGILIHFLKGKKKYPIYIGSGEKFEKAILALYNLGYEEIEPKMKFKYYFNDKNINSSKTLKELGIINDSIIYIKKN